MLLGLFAGYLLARWRAKRQRLPGRHIDNLGLILSVVGILGSIVFGRLFYFQHLGDFWDAFAIWRGGAKVFYGGVVFSVIAVMIYSLVMRLSLTRLGDVLTPSIALGLAIGRIGCFMAGCCWGDLCHDRFQVVATIQDTGRSWQVQTVPFMSGANWPLAVRFPKDSHPFCQHVSLGLIDKTAESALPVHPVQLYEATLVLGLCIMLNFLFRRRKRSGEVFLIFVMSYACIRFAIEFFRADNSPDYLGLTVSQVVAVVTGLICAGVFILRRRFVGKLGDEAVAAEEAGAFRSGGRHGAGEESPGN